MLHNNVSLLCCLTKWKKKRGGESTKLNVFSLFRQKRKYKIVAQEQVETLVFLNFIPAFFWLAECAYTSILFYLLVSKMTLIIPALQRHTENSLRIERFSDERCSGSAGVSTYSFLVLQMLLSSGPKCSKF